MGNGKNRGVFVRVDRDDLGRFLHAGPMLDRTADSTGDVQRGTNRSARLADLVFMTDVTAVHGGPACTHGAAEGTGEIENQVEILLATHSGPTGNDDPGALEVQLAFFDFPLDDFHREKGLIFQ